MKLPDRFRPSSLLRRTSPAKRGEAENAKDAKSRGNRGVALVTVLTVMALATIMVLTFFGLASSEHRASTTYSHGLQAQQVAEQAVNMVIAQIRKGTTTGGTDYAWASQPGMIRVWDDSDFHKGYKLYSDDQMVETSQSALSDDFGDLDGWSSSPDRFVDLNEPVIRGEKVYYPIVHPQAADLPKWRKAFAGDNAGIEGFRYNWDSGHRLTDVGPMGAKADSVARSDEGHVAMPVRWIYQLSDGTLGTLDSSDRFDTMSGSGTPSEENPIVARFAFWADDETTKLNLNTHAGGLAWDTPRAGGQLDMDMGQKQPAQREWQRYPGHPATTHITPALAPGVIDIVQDKEAMEMLFEVVPRVVGGGSESGTRLIDTNSPEEWNGLVADKDPLFPSVDDIVMRPDRSLQQFPDASGNPLSEEELSEYLERAKFFITVTSRAPETNVFNKPRVAIWPLYNADGAPEYVDDPDSPSYPGTKYTVFDQLIRYCSSMGQASSGGYDRYEYSFKRQKADSATYDIEIPRNAQLYDYLYDLMGTKIPGVGDSFVSKYGSDDTKQLITEIFDYIRSSNLHDDTLYGAENFEEAFTGVNTQNHRSFTNPRDGSRARNGIRFNLGFGHKGHGQVTPTVHNGTKGMGRFFTLSGAHVMVSVVAEPDTYPPRGNDPRWPAYPGVTSYQNILDQAEEGIGYSNIPPLHSSVLLRNDDGFQESALPQWIKSLKTTDPDLYEAQLDPAQWNWQLAFLHAPYRNAVLSNPTANKFNRDLLPTGGTAPPPIVLSAGEYLAQAIFLFDLFSPSVGWSGINPDMQIEITRNNGMTFQGGAVEFLGFSGQDAMSDPDRYVWATNWIKPHREGGLRAWGGLLPFQYAFQARDVLADQTYKQGNSWNGSLWWQMWNSRESTSGATRSRFTPIDRGYNLIENALRRVEGNRDVKGKLGNSLDNIAQAYRYDLVTVPFKVTPDIEFDGGEVRFEIFDAGEHTEVSAPDDMDDADWKTLVQTIELDFPPFSFTPGVDSVHLARPHKGHVNEFQNLSRDSTSVLEQASLTADPGNPWNTPKMSARKRGGPWANSNPTPPSHYDQRYGEARGHNVRGRMADAAIHWNGGFVKEGDIVQSVAVSHGDVRIVAARDFITASENVFEPHRDYGSNPMAHSLTNSMGQAMAGFNANDAKPYMIIPDLPGGRPYNNKIPLTFPTKRSSEVQLYGDFDNGAGTMIDGPYINKPDEGNIHSLQSRMQQEVVDRWEALRDRGEYPYFSHPEKAEAGGPAYFSPNRILPGPGMFGSLPSQASSNKPWQTLLFRPNVEGNGYSSHPGAEDPHDHYILDLFWMPVVEPYAISEPLSTAGKINMNYQIQPFLHIDRNTALRGVFRSELVLCIPNQWHQDYKHAFGRGRRYHWRDRPFDGRLQGKRLRATIVEDKTLEQFQDKFDEGELFRSSSEICEIHLIAEEVAERLGIQSNQAKINSYVPTLEQMENGKYWRDHSLVGDNSRERPYTNMQTRLTTKSNTFKVYYRAQVLKQGRRESSSGYGTWDPALDTVQAEYRGSTIVERYVDPDDDRIPDYATEGSGAPALDEFYKFRLVNPRRFAP